MDKPVKLKRHFTDEHRAKISAALKGKPSGRKGIPMSDESRAKISAALMGNVPWNKGKTFSESHKKKLSEAKIGRPGPWTGKKRPGLTGKNHPRWKGGYENQLHLNRRRKAQKKANGGNHSLAQWLELKATYQNRCAMCLEEKKLTADHIVPISLGGSDSIDNIQPLCSSCNASKGNRWIKKI